MKEIAIIFPNQLHRKSEILEKKLPIYLIEEFLFFRQYRFHKQKIVFHRSSMKEYENYLINKSVIVSYIDSFNQSSDIRNFIKDISSEVDKIHVIDPVDYLLEKRMKKTCTKYNISL
jgi:deoxyribodipyrimidine photolyase-related protein